MARASCLAWNWPPPSPRPPSRGILAKGPFLELPKLLTYRACKVRPGEQMATGQDQEALRGDSIIKPIGRCSVASLPRCPAQGRPRSWMLGSKNGSDSPRQVLTGFWALLGAASLAFMSTLAPAQTLRCFSTAPAQKIYISLPASWA